MELECRKKFSKFFHELEYNEKLDFTKFEYPKNNRSLYIFETAVDCNIICKKILLGYFHQNSIV